MVHWRRVSWQAGARWFLRHLLDGDPASNNLSWQWVASSFGSKPYIFNRENLERFSSGRHCRSCPRTGRGGALKPGGCPFEASYEDLQQRLFDPSAGPPAALRFPAPDGGAAAPLIPEASPSLIRATGGAPAAPEPLAAASAIPAASQAPGGVAAAPGPSASASTSASATGSAIPAVGDAPVRGPVPPDPAAATVARAPGSPLVATSSAIPEPTRASAGAPEGAASGAIPPRRPILWIHGEALGPANPVWDNCPEAPAVFVFDRELIAGLTPTTGGEAGAPGPISLKRLGFLYECLRELPVTLRVGDMADEVIAFARRHGADGVVTSEAVDPRFTRLLGRIAAVLPVRALEPEPFVVLNESPGRPRDPGRFSRYWKKAEDAVWKGATGRCA